MSELTDPVEQLIKDAKSGPECFECGEPIVEFEEVRIVTVRVNHEPLNVWMHAGHIRPEPR